MPSRVLLRPAFVILALGCLAALLSSGPAFARDGKDVKVHNKSKTKLWFAEYQKRASGSARRTKSLGALAAGEAKTFTLPSMSHGTMRRIRWGTKNEFKAEYSNREWQDVKNEANIGTGINSIYIDGKPGQFKAYTYKEWQDHTGGSEKSSEKILIRNRTLEDPRDLYVALYQCGARECERVQGPWKIDVASSHEITKVKSEAGHTRKLRWSTKESDLKKILKTQGAWKQVGGHVNFGPAGTGFKTCNISDKGRKGEFTSRTDTGDWFAGGWRDTWAKVWDKLTSAGDTCVIFNNTRRSWYVAEYQRKTKYAGKATRLQGGTGKKWRVAPGESISFKKAKLDVGYTARWVRWQAKEGAPQTVESGEFKNHSGWKGNSTLVGKIYLEYDKNGDPKGYTTLELEARNTALHQLIYPLIKKVHESKSPMSFKVPVGLLDDLGIGTGLLSELDRVTQAALGGVKPETWINKTLTPRLEAAIPIAELKGVMSAAAKLPKPSTQLIELFRPGYSKPENGAAIHRKMKTMGVIPTWESTSTATRTRGLGARNRGHLVSGYSIGIAFSGERPLRPGGPMQSLSITVALTWLFSEDAAEKHSFSIGFAIQTGISTPGDGSGSLGIALVDGPVYYLVEDPNDFGSHGIIVTGNPLSGSLGPLSTTLALDLIIPFRGFEEDGGFSARVGVGLALALPLSNVGYSTGSTSGEASASASFGIGYGWGTVFAR